MTTAGPRIVLLGKPGAGKGTQAKALSDHYGVEHLSTGELFRAAAAEGTPTGLEVGRYMDTGELVPDEIVIRVVDEYFREDGPLDDGFVLDGFPRTLRQAEELERVLVGHPLDVVIDIEVPTDVILDRIAGRRVCEQCAANYHVNMPPKQDAICDKCGGRVVQRADDTEEAVARRLEIYAVETVPIVEFYRALGKLVDVDGVGEGDQVFKRIVAEVDSRYDAVAS